MTFAKRVYRVCQKIPKSKVTTYKEIARVLGIKGYQAIGQALKCNPYAPDVPCHRVVRSDGSIGGFKGKMSGREIQKKVSLLQNERIQIINGKVDLDTYGYFF